MPVSATENLPCAALPCALANSWPNPAPIMTLQDMIGRASRYKGRLAAISVLALLGSASLLAIPALAGSLFGGAISGFTVGTGGITIMLVLALSLTAFFTMASSMVTATTSARILADLRCEVFDHVARLPLEFHDGSQQGDLIALATHEVSELSGFLTSTLANVPAMLATSVGATVMLFFIDPVLAMVIPGLIPLFFVLLKLFSRRLRKLAAKARKAEAKVYSEAESHLQMMMVTKSFAAESSQSRRYASAVEQSRAKLVAVGHAGAAIAPLSGLLAGCAAIFVIVMAGSQLSADEKSSAELFTFLLYAALLTRPIGALTNVYGRWQIVRGTLGRLNGVLKLPEEPGYQAQGELSQVRGAIAFEDVSFGYEGRARLLHGLDLAIAPCETVAIVGENGCGKSTMAKLLQRFYDAQGGSITLDGMDIRELNVQFLRRQIGYVPQRAHLFSGTIRENIEFGSIPGDAVNLDRALRLAQASEFIARLPDGLDTMIGDNGVRLSGGQRQRITLARALLCDPAVLIFDEATAMWDLESEAAFVDSCKEALAGRTVVIITHRPASLALAGRVVALIDGRCNELSAGTGLEKVMAGRIDEVVAEIAAQGGEGS